MSEPTFTHDVFLSHSSKDKPVVRELAARLKQDGIRVWLDEWEIRPGDSIPSKVEEGLEQSRVLVLCMSANAFGSDWAQLEAGTFRFRDPLNKKRSFVPLRIDEAPIKGSLTQFLYIDWLPANRAQNYAQLLGACRAVTATPCDEIKQSTRIDGDQLQGRFTSCSDFFHSQFTSAFPGLRLGQKRVTELGSMLARLSRLLIPLKYNGISPVWWFRGPESCPIDSFRILDSKTVLLGTEELELSEVVAVDCGAYWNCFVYLEAHAVSPSDAYGHEHLPPIGSRGYLSEEVCLFRGRYFDRVYFDDGALEIDGHVVDVSGEAEIRIRHLTKYNLVIAASDSSVADPKFEDQLHELMNRALLSPESITTLANEVRKLPKRVRYFA